MYGHTITTQADLDSVIADLREAGFPYLGSDDARHQLVTIDGEALILWDVPGEPQWEYVLSTQDEWWDSVNGWWYDY